MKYMSVGICFLFLAIACVSSLRDGSYNTSENSWYTTFVLDVSHSMNVTDGTPEWRSRLNTAKSKIQEIVSEIPHQFGLTVFSWNPQRVIPHTTDIGLFLTLLSGIDRQNVSQWGTNLGLALQEAIQDFIDDTSWNIVLFSDGGEWEIEKLQDISNTLKQKQVEVTIVGVGSTIGGHIPLGRDVFGRTTYVVHNGERVVSQLTESNLKSTAKKLWGTYIHIDDFEIESIPDAQTHNILHYTGTTTMILIMIAFIFWIYFLVFLYVHIHFWIWRR